MQKDLRGSHKFLKMTGQWLVFFLLDFFCIEIISIGREFFEELYYNVSLSSQIGDRALIAYILIASDVLKKQQIRSNWIESKIFHIFCIVLSIGVGITIEGRSLVQLGKIGEIMDAYHGSVVVSIFLYFILTTTPVIFVYGTKTQKVAAVFLLLTWLGTLAIDLFTGRLQQREWLQQHGVQFRR